MFLYGTFYKLINVAIYFLFYFGAFNGILIHLFGYLCISFRFWQVQSSILQ